MIGPNNPRDTPRGAEAGFQEDPAHQSDDAQHVRQSIHVPEITSPGASVKTFGVPDIQLHPAKA